MNCCTHDESFNCICACHGSMPRKFYDLMQELETLPASEQQTKCVVMLAELRDACKGPEWLKFINDPPTVIVDGVRVSRELFKFWHDDANAGKLFRLVTAGEVPTLTVERRPESELQKNAPPKHPFELTIRIGGNDFDYVKRTAQDIATHIAECGENCSLASGGWGGCHSVDIEKRDITPEAYRAELEAWSSTK
jgi:hypothetical protein